MAAKGIDKFCDDNDVGRSRVYADIRAGRLRAKKFGTRTLITDEAERDWLASLPDFQAAAA